MRSVLAVDGGNSKTDVALVADDGELLGLARGPLSSPHHIGLDGSVGVLDALRAEACGGEREPVDVGVFLLAGLDFDDEERLLEAEVDARGWATRTIVGNDTFAILRAGTEQGWGVAVTCGAGINCVGVSPDGLHVRFPALGELSGDWGGGHDVGMAALSAAARSEDGRGPRTSLERLVPAHFGYDTPLELVRAIHVGDVGSREVVDLAPVVLGAADDDSVAAGIVDRLAVEVVALARAALTRLDLTREATPVVLGGGLLRSGDPRLLRGIEGGLHEVGSRLAVAISESPPIVGSALLGLDELGANARAKARLRRELGNAVSQLTTPEEVG